MKLDSKEIFGAEIQYFRLEPRYWEPILLRFKETGLRTVSTYVQWETHLVGEPDRKHPAGVLDFTGKSNPQLNLLRFLDLVHKHDLNLNFRCGPFCCNEMPQGGYPHWLVFGDPGIMVWDWQNRTTQGYWTGRRAGSQPSYLHPDYLDWCRKWIAEVDRIVKPRLMSNGGFITMLNLDNEVSYIVRDSFLDSDYNPVNVRPGGFYHQFLGETYGDVKALSAAYGTNYAAIEDVPPPRAVPESAGRDFSWYADWMRFKTWCMSRYIAEVRQMHEVNGVKDVLFMTNFNPHLPEGVPTRMPDFEKAANGIAGYDFYRGCFMSYSGYHSMARVLKLMNASLKYSWSAEFMAGSWNKDMSKTSRVSDDHMRFMARCALAQGCKALGWFMFHDRIVWGDAPVSSHGHPRSSLRVLQDTVDLTGRRIKHWDALKPRMDCAVIYDLIQHVHTGIGAPMPCDDNHCHLGKPVVAGVEAGRASQEYYGLFRLVEHAGYQAGVVDVMHDAGRLADCRLAFLPGSPVVERVASAALAAWVKKGGVLVVSGPWPTLDECGRPFAFLGVKKPAPTLALGRGRLVWHGDYQAQAEPEKDELAAIARCAELLERLVGPSHVRIRPAQPVTWVDWKDGGGHREFNQPRNLGSAILHQGGGERILFVLNHGVDAVVYELTFADPSARRLVDLDTAEVIPVTKGRAVADLDRKSCRVFRMA